MKKYILSTLMVAIFVFYLTYQRSVLDSNNTTTVPTTKDTISINQGLTTYKDGSYTGVRSDAYYGYVNVRAIVQNGKITDVQFLEYPNDQRESRDINGRAVPFLISEALKAQSADVAIVSRATDTSLAFRKSLAAALAQAKS